MLQIEAGAASRPSHSTELNDDRTVLLPQVGRFALFDGAGQHLASELASRVFRSAHESRTEFSPLYTVFNDIQASVEELQQHSEVVTYYEEIGFDANMLRTTGIAVGLRMVSSARSPGAKVPIFEYLGFGDSSLYLFEPEPKRFGKVTRDDSFDYFLGAPDVSAPDYVPPNRGGFLLRGPLIAALVSDGITADDPWKGFVSDEMLEEILSSAATPHDKAEAIVAASSITDDASAIVIEAQP